MAIKVGDKVPDVTLRTMTADGPAAVQSGDVLGSGKVVLIAVPARSPRRAPTTTCPASSCAPRTSRARASTRWRASR